VKVKRSGPTPKLQTYAPQPPAAAPPPGTPPAGAPGGDLSGAWQSGEGSGVIFQGNQWGYFQGGQMVDGGLFQIRGDQLLTQSAYTKETRAYRFRASGNQLLIQDETGEVHRFTRVK
jgi:hypothetical protein